MKEFPYYITDYYCKFLNKYKESPGKCVIVNLKEWTNYLSQYDAPISGSIGNKYLFVPDRIIDVLPSNNISHGEFQFLYGPNYPDP